MSADVVILTVGVVLGGGRQREDTKNEKKKKQFIVFSQPNKTPNGSKTKVHSADVRREPGGNFVKKPWVL